MCCLEAEFCCKTGVAEDKRPMCFCIGCGCVSPSTCIKQQQQCCCCVSAAAIPPDEEVPCMVSMWGLNCYPKGGCCQEVDVIRGVAGDPGAGGSTVGNESG